MGSIKSFGEITSEIGNLTSKVNDLKALRLKTLEDKRVGLVGQLIDIDSLLEEARNDWPERPQTPEKDRDSSPRKLTKDILAQVFIANSNKPMVIKDLCVAAIALGWKTKSANPGEIVCQTLHQSKYFKKSGHVMTKCGKLGRSWKWQLKADKLKHFS